MYLAPGGYEPTLFASLVVRAGGKQDPPHATGLAHYLEHMMFKGTSRFGTRNWRKEQPLLAQIENLFNAYGQLKNTQERQACYNKIDALSQKAAQYALANEYDKMMSALGVSMTNAYTSEDRTVYVNQIPANQLDNWLAVEAERFNEMVPRLFHTELETVYEEKNRACDDDGWRMYETMLSALFPNHPYGTKPLIGTVEHLKNPSITEIKRFFNTYYCPNNMALCLSGDMDPNNTLKLIEKHFGHLKSNPALPKLSKQTATNVTTQEQKLWGPSPEEILIATRCPTLGDNNYLPCLLCDMILANGQAGLIDLNLKQNQKVLSASVFLSDMYDYGAHILQARPKKDQSLQEVKNLLWQQITRLQDGDWDETLIQAIANDIEKHRLKREDNNEAMCRELVETFAYDLNWQEYQELPHRVRDCSAAEVQSFAQQTYNTTQRVIIFKHTGEAKDVKKVPKPNITQLKLNKEDTSEFHEQLLKQKVNPILPKFADFEKDIQHGQHSEYETLCHAPNNDNDLFHAEQLYEIGLRHEPRTQVALAYLDYLAPKGLSINAFKQKFYALGGEQSLSLRETHAQFQLQGLSRHKKELWHLWQRLLFEPQEDEKVLKEFKADILKERENIKKDKRKLLFKGLLNYAMYGPKSPLRHRMPEKELKEISSQQLLQDIEQLAYSKKRLLHHGPGHIQNLTQFLNSCETNFEKKDPHTAKPYPFQKKEVGKQPKVYFLPYDMLQVEMLFVCRQPRFAPEDMAQVLLFNEYFSGSMHAPVFQELREARALAYAATARYVQPQRLQDFGHFFMYIGTQPDKQQEALTAMQHLLQNFPAIPENFALSQQVLIKQLCCQRFQGPALLSHYEQCRRLNLTQSPASQTLHYLKHAHLDDVAEFHQKRLAQQNYHLLVMGNEKYIDKQLLADYGEIHVLSPEELFDPYRDKVSSVSVSARK